MASIRSIYKILFILKILSILSTTTYRNSFTNDFLPFASTSTLVDL